MKTETVEARAVKIAAKIMQADGLCRYDDVDKCRRVYATNAMGFPPDYIIDRDYLGNEYGKTKQVARCGNAVCPPMATALVRANLPEWCSRTITTMEELEKAVTA